MASLMRAAHGDAAPDDAARVAAEPEQHAGSPATMSLFHYAPAMAILLIVIANTQRFTDPDLWGHLRFGQVVLAVHHLVRLDPYSYTALGAPWRNHEWLTEVTMAFFYNHFGVIGLKIWKLGCVTAAISGVMIALAETGATPITQLLLMMLATVAVMPQMQFRPQLFTFALFAWLLVLLQRHALKRRSHLWLVIPMMALWANFHGGFIAGLGALGMYTAATAARDLRRGDGFGAAFKLGALTVAALLATLATPYGVDTWVAVLNALRNPVTRVAVSDWQPLLFHLAEQWRLSHMGTSFYFCALTLMATAVIAFVRYPTLDDLPMMAVAALMIVAAFTAVRNLPLAVMACILPAARHLALARAARPTDEESTSERHSGANQIAIACAALFLIFYSDGLSSRLETEQRYPEGAVSFLQSHHLKGNILADFGWGEYLIWHTPESKIYIDGRYDTVFSGKVIGDYLKFFFNDAGVQQVLTDYPHDFILLAPKAPIVKTLRGLPGWKLIYEDDDAVLFIRAGEPIALATSSVAKNPTPKHQYFP